MSRIAVFLPCLAGGGAERSLVSLADGLARRGHEVHLVLAHADGEYLASLPSTVKLFDLKRQRVLSAVRPLTAYLRKEQPQALLSALDHANVAAILAGRLSRTKTRIVVSLRNTLGEEYATPSRGQKLTLTAARRLYPAANAVVAVSNGVADDAARVIGLPRNHIVTIYNPVITPSLHAQAAEPPIHPWFSDGGPPVVLGVGRLNAQKDFPTLLKAFGRLKTPARLMILGEGEKRTELEALAGPFGDRVSLPGFSDNPFPAMAACGVFALSSRFEGLPGALVQAMACGAPVVSTDCPSGPREILEDGRWGALVPVGDDAALTSSIEVALNAPRPDYPGQTLARFEEAPVLDAYEALLLG
ncbi:glycosyltransferase [bacterium]|nr:MAG: glycosyltransferase [bacterium]